MNQPNKERFKTSVGGQALMEGIMMRGPKNICCAVRKPDGTIETKVEPTPTHGVWTKIPLVRGAISMIESLIMGYKYMMYSAQVSMGDDYDPAEEETAFEKWVGEHLGEKAENALLTIAAVLGGSLGNVILIAGITSWVRYARLVRGEILSIKESEYIEAIRAEGGSDARIIFRHILPNVISSVIVIATLEMAKIVLMEASLSFLGYGVPITIPTWGRMLSEARANMVSNPWQCILPGLCITLTVLGVNLLGDWLRDYLDPKLDV